MQKKKPPPPPKKENKPRNPKKILVLIEYKTCRALSFLKMCQYLNNVFK